MKLRRIKFNNAAVSFVGHMNLSDCRRDGLDMLPQCGLIGQFDLSEFLTATVGKRDTTGIKAALCVVLHRLFLDNGNFDFAFGFGA